jgi:hypothetical protein
MRKYFLFFVVKTIRDMKHKGNKGENSLYRERKIKELFTKLKRTGKYGTIGEICREISCMEMDRYYISEERACEIYYRYRRNGTIESCSKYAYTLRLDLVHLCEKIRKEKGIESMRHVVREALEYPAQCIGISPSRIQRILEEGGML